MTIKEVLENTTKLQYSLKLHVTDRAILNAKRLDYCIRDSMHFQTL